MIRGLLTALEMKGIQDTFIRHQLCPSRVGAEHSEVSQPRSQALDPGKSARLAVRTPGLNPLPSCVAWASSFSSMNLQLPLL